MFCGRYDLVSIFLTKSEASPFVRDHLRSRNLLDYIELDVRQAPTMETFQKKCELLDSYPSTSLRDRCFYLLEIDLRCLSMSWQTHFR